MSKISWGGDLHSFMVAVGMYQVHVSGARIIGRLLSVDLKCVFGIRGPD